MAKAVASLRVRSLRIVSAKKRVLDRRQQNGTTRGLESSVLAGNTALAKAFAMFLVFGSVLQEFPFLERIGQGPIQFFEDQKETVVASVGIGRESRGSPCQTLDDVAGSRRLVRFGGLLQGRQKQTLLAQVGSTGRQHRWVCQKLGSKGLDHNVVPIQQRSFYSLYRIYNVVGTVSQHLIESHVGMLDVNYPSVRGAVFLFLSFVKTLDAGLFQALLGKPQDAFDAFEHRLLIIVGPSSMSSRGGFSKGGIGKERGRVIRLDGRNGGRFCGNNSHVAIRIRVCVCVCICIASNGGKAVLAGFDRLVARLSLVTGYVWRNGKLGGSCSHGTETMKIQSVAISKKERINGLN